jgi:hypothetical protein
MASSDLKQRKPVHNGVPIHGQEPKLDTETRHPAGPVKHGLAKQALRALLFTVYFTLGCVT